MGQLTIARFRGDTAFGFVTRILSTFFGCIVGLVIWWVALILVHSYVHTDERTSGIYQLVMEKGIRTA